MTDMETSAGFARRHLGPREGDIRVMLETIGLTSLDELIARAVPGAIQMTAPLELEEPVDEPGLDRQLRQIAGRNRPWRSFLGLGYSDCHTPPVIQRNILENPGWYTQYTPYQAEIAQGRLEALLNFQTAVADLTGMPLANASLLDEATAAAEAMAMFHGLSRGEPGDSFFVADDCHPQTIAVVRTRAEARGWRVVSGDPDQVAPDSAWFGALLQYPGTDGRVRDLSGFVARAHAVGVLVAAAADLLSLCLLRPPGEWGVDAVLGSAQRFGMPMGYGGPHAAFFATRSEYRRLLPGRIVGVSRDSRGRPALRLALQTREQHIRRERATSNICTAQVLPAVVAAAYAVYHGPEGLRQLAATVHQRARQLAAGARGLGHQVVHPVFFDTVRLRPPAGRLAAICQRASEHCVNLRLLADGDLAVALDEATTAADVAMLLTILAAPASHTAPPGATAIDPVDTETAPHVRQSPYLVHPVFHRYQSETEMLRYLRRLESRDLSLAQSMIPLGSCTMKLNPTAAMAPITWPEFGRVHPFAPVEQAGGYQQVIGELAGMLQRITGFAAVSLQPNSGAQGEYAGLLVIRQYHRRRGAGERDVCLIPASAHGTNPASAAMAGLQVVVVRCDDSGNIDLEDLREQATRHHDRLAALMVTYPSTHGVFEETIRTVCAVVHEHGGQVYMDGANMNAMVGLCRPADIGADVCHLNLHKTFAIPHGGGGPGMGPIAVAAHLAPFLPGHPLVPVGGTQAIGPVAAAPWGSALVLLISWAYLRLMGSAGATQATRLAILNANYVATRLAPSYPVLYRGAEGLVAHEAILDLRRLKDSSGITVEDVAKRLMDYGFHAPTVSFPVAGTLMVEPTESESLAELDRFCEAMIAIRGEIDEVARGTADREDNVLRQAPHPAEALADDPWPHAYSRRRAAFPAPWSADDKFWPAVARIDNALGDRQLMCACPPVETYATPTTDRVAPG
jgi:glycine dehydrogenase